MKILKLTLFFFIVVNTLQLHGQILNGVWEGNYQKRLINNPKLLSVELSVTNDTLINGYSHLLYKNQNYEHHKVTGFFNKLDSTLTFSETLLESTHNAYEVKYKMKLFVNDSSYRLVGRWTPKKNINLNMPLLNKVWLSKKKTTFSNKYNDRLDSIQKIIELNSGEVDSIKLSIYDNGVIDNDSITVILNDSVIVNHQMLNAKPILSFISIGNKKQFQKLKIVADNLGSIPPNTALLVVETKYKRYEIHLSSDLKKNGVVEFVFLK